MLFPGAADSFADLARVFCGARFGQACGELGQFRLEEVGLLGVDRPVLLRTRRRIAIEQGFVTAGLGHPLDLHRHPVGGRHLGCLVGVEDAGLLAADHDIAIALAGEPGQIFLTGDAGIHHHRGAGRSGQCQKHFLECSGLSGIAGKDAAAFGEATHIEHQPRGHQRTIAALFLGSAALGFANPRCHSLKICVRQIVERYRLADIEKRLCRAKDMGFEGVAVLEKIVGAAIQLLQFHAFKVVTDQLSQPRTVAQPRKGRQLAGGSRHAADDIPHRGGDLRFAEAKFDQLALDAEPAQSRQRGVLHADTARPDKFQGFNVDVLEAIRRSSRRIGLTGRLAARPGDHPRRITLGQGFDGRAYRHQRCLPPQQFVDARGQGDPFGLRQIEMRSQIQKRALPHGAADARRLNQTKSEILFASLAIASIRTPNEHPPTLLRDIGKKQPQIGRYL